MVCISGSGIDFECQIWLSKARQSKSKFARQTTRLCSSGACMPGDGISARSGMKILDCGRSKVVATIRPMIFCSDIHSAGTECQEDSLLCHTCGAGGLSTNPKILSTPLALARGLARGKSDASVDLAATDQRHSPTFKFTSTSQTRMHRHFKPLCAQLQESPTSLSELVSSPTSTIEIQQHTTHPSS